MLFFFFHFATMEIETAEPIVEQVPSRFSGIFYTLCAVVLFTGSAFVTKQLDVDFLDALILRFFLQTFSLLIYIRCVKNYPFYRQLKKNELVFLFINLFSTTTAFLSFFIAYRFLPLADLTTIRYTQVIWTLILSSWIYREKPSIPIVCAILLTMIGVILVAQPQFLFLHGRSTRLIGIFISLYTAVGMSIIVISNKHLLLHYRTKHSLIMFQFTFVTLIILLLHFFVRFTLKKTHWNEILNWKFALASSVNLLQIVSSMLTQKAIKREHPSIFTIVQSIDILFSLILQNVFTSTHSNLLSICGSIFVLTSVFLVGCLKFCFY